MKLNQPQFLAAYFVILKNEKIADVADGSNVSPATIRRWMDAYTELGHAKQKLVMDLINARNAYMNSDCNWEEFGAAKRHINDAIHLVLETDK